MYVNDTEPEHKQHKCEHAYVHVHINVHIHLPRDHEHEHEHGHLHVNGSNGGRWGNASPC
jgi:hypothetical protein